MVVMSRTRLLFAVLLTLAASAARGVAPLEKTGQPEGGKVEGVVGTGIGQGAEQYVKHGERPRVLVRNLRGLGNRSTRNQIANRLNKLIKETKEVGEKYGLKWVSPVLTATDIVSSERGSLWEGDYRGAGTSLVTSGARELAAGVGAAGGAGAMYMLGAAGFSVGGPIGGAVGGAVGAVVAAIGYDLYLSEQVKGVADALWGEEHDPEYYVNLARANRQEFKAKEREALAKLHKATKFVPYGEDQIRQFEATVSQAKTGEQPPKKDEQTEQLERRAKALAENRLGPRDSNAKPDPNEAKPIIPEDCTIEVAVGDANSGKTYVDTYKVLGNTVTATRAPLIVPEKKGQGFWDAEEQYNYAFEGTLQGNVIVGKWVSTAGTEGKRYESNGSLFQYAKGTVKQMDEVRIVLFGDGTVSWELASETEVRSHALVGVFDADTGSTEVFRTTPWPKQTGSGVWQIRRRETTPPVSTEVPK